MTVIYSSSCAWWMGLFSKCCSKKRDRANTGECGHACRPLANPKVLRKASDVVDMWMGWDAEHKKNSSRIRGVLHGIWHTGAYIITRNPLEWTRAKIQFKGQRTSA